MYPVLSRNVLLLSNIGYKIEIKNRVSPETFLQVHGVYSTNQNPAWKDAANIRPEYGLAVSLNR